MYRLLLLIGLVLTSCAPAYVANTKNVPMFSDAKQFTANVSYLSGIDAQVAYSFSHHLAGMVNGNVVIKKFEIADNSKGPEPPRPHHVFYEGGVGYFTRSENFHFEVFGGYGVGHGYSQTPILFAGDNAGIIEGRYNRIFLQPSISLHEKKLQIIFTPRVSFVSFQKFTTISGNAPMNTSELNNYYVYFEPSFTGRFGLYRALHGYIQLGANLPYSKWAYSANYLQMAFGLQLQIYRLGKHVD